MKSYSFTLRTTLRASSEEVLAHAGAFAGVNRELWPLVQMTHPPELCRFDGERFPLGRTAFRSWFLLFGLVPVEFDDFRLIGLDPGRGFDEQSRLLSTRDWRHRRTVTPAAGGCVVCDEITMTPRLRWTGGILAAAFRFIFEWRHRRLRRLWRGKTP
jgi:hypothetical protein